ncbi:MAG: antitoxin [Betaproteobacteria bacterium]|nr:antitoxin [Betaproteobacteria bacterium]
MRTTLDIDPDIPQSAKELARREGKTAGQVISELVRRALTTGTGAREPEAEYGFQPFASRGNVVTNEDVNRLRDQGEY